MFLAAFGLGRELGINFGKSLQCFLQLGAKQRSAFDYRKSGAGGGVSVIWAKLWPRPFFLPVVVRGNKENFLVNFAAAVASHSLCGFGNQHEYAVGLIPSGEVIEHFVLTKRRGGYSDFVLAVTEKHNHAVARLMDQAGAPVVIVSETAFIPGK